MTRGQYSPTSRAGTRTQANPQGSIDEPLRALTLAVAAAATFNGSEEQARVAGMPCPYGDGHVGPRVAALLAAPAVQAVLALEEPRLDDPRPIMTPVEVAAP